MSPDRMRSSPASSAIRFSTQGVANPSLLPSLRSGDGLWTVPQVARLLALRPSTIRAYAERGTLPCVRIGNRLRFLPSDISAWIESRHSKGGP
jgi:excisionase family DNA binding protein